MIKDSLQRLRRFEYLVPSLKDRDSKFGLASVCVDVLVHEPWFVLQWVEEELWGFLSWERPNRYNDGP